MALNIFPSEIASHTIKTAFCRDLVEEKTGSDSHKAEKLWVFTLHTLESDDVLSLALCGVALPQTEIACNLGSSGLMVFAGGPGG